MTVEQVRQQIQLKSRWSASVKRINIPFHMELWRALMTASIWLGIDFISLKLLLLEIFTHSLLKATFNCFRSVDWTSLKITAMSNMFQRCFMEFRDGEYAGQGQTFPGFAWILMLSQKEHCCTQTKKINPSVFHHLRPFPHPARADIKRFWHF